MVKATDLVGLSSRDQVLQVGIRACLILGFIWGYVFTTRPAVECHGRVVLCLISLRDCMRFM